MANKTKIIKLRLTEEEYLKLKERSHKYNGKISSLIRSALAQLDDRQAREKFQVIDAYIKYWQENENELRHIGGNFNQAMKRINELAVVGLLDENDAHGMVKDVKEVWTKLYEYIAELNKISHQILR